MVNYKKVWIAKPPSTMHCEPFGFWQETSLALFLKIPKKKKLIPF